MTLGLVLQLLLLIRIRNVLADEGMYRRFLLHAESFCISRQAIGIMSFNVGKRDFGSRKFSR
jgi:hypothetical protein